MDCVPYVGAESLNAGRLQMNSTLCRLRTDHGIMHLTDTNVLLLNTPKYENETAENCILVEKLAAQRLLGISRHSFGDNNTTELIGLRQDGKEWINVAQDRESWRDVANTVVKP